MERKLMRTWQTVLLLKCNLNDERPSKSRVFYLSFVQECQEARFSAWKGHGVPLPAAVFVGWKSLRSGIVLLEAIMF